MIVYRPMIAEDIPAGLFLCRAAGWNQTAEDWELFLRLSPEGCRVAVDQGEHVRGTVATVKYENHFSWIGMVLVDPAMQRQGIGIQLLRESLCVLCDEDTIKLDATPAGRQIYVQLDFADEYAISRMEARKFVANDLPTSGARPAESKDWAALLSFDRQVFGADREMVLQSMLKRAPQYAFVSEDRGRINGYCFGRPGHYFSQIGPVIASDFDTARAVASAALQNCAGSPVVIDALHQIPGWKQWLSSIGFIEQRPLIRMYRGSNAYPGIPEKQFAILGPEFG